MVKAGAALIQAHRLVISLGLDEVLVSSRAGYSLSHALPHAAGDLYVSLMHPQYATRSFVRFRPHAQRFVLALAQAGHSVVLASRQSRQYSCELEQRVKSAAEDES